MKAGSGGRWPPVDGLRDTIVTVSDRVEGLTSVTAERDELREVVRQIALAVTECPCGCTSGISSAQLRRVRELVGSVGR